MPKVIIHGVLAVGMHHYNGPLTVGAGYRLLREVSNIHDVNAVAIVENATDARQIHGHLKRDAAKLLARVIDARLSSRDVYYLKPKGRPFLHSRRCGVVQVCNVGFHLKEEDVERAQHIVVDQGFSVTYIP